MELTQIRIPYYVLFNVALLSSLLVAFFSWKNRKSPGALAFMASVLLETLWLAGYMFELSSTTLAEKLMWDKIEYIGALYAPIFLLVFAFQFTKRRVNLSTLVPVLLVISTIFQILIFVDFWPELTYANPRIEDGLPFAEFRYDFGAITTLANIYAQALSLTYIGILVAAFFNQRNLFREQLIIVTVGTAIPVLGVILALFIGIEFANQRDVSPLMFAFSNVVIAWGIFRKRLFNVAPIARELLFQKMNNILIILDETDRILDVNPAARKILGYREKEDLIGTHISLLQPELYQEFGKKVEIQTEITAEDGTTFSFEVTPLYNNRGLLMGRLINANDITEQKRTEENLKQINIENSLRARRLNAITDVSQAVSQIRDLKPLLPVITRQISDKFDFYHVGIFLFSEDRRFAELIAANSEGGKRMLERGHRLEVGQVGVVGKVAQDGTPRVALDVGQDAVYFDNPDLPETRSEMALPLKIGLDIIGVLDVQSKRKNVFSKEDTEVFSALANQVAIAIENARQVQATQAALEEAYALTREYVRESWAKQAESGEESVGYRYVNDSVIPFGDAEFEAKAGDKIMEVPVQIRDETIGVIKVRIPEGQSLQMTDSDSALLKAVSERAGLALESARFLEETQKKAQRETLISDISAKIGASIRMDNIIQTTVRELGVALNAADVAFQLTEAKEDGDE